MDDSRTNGHYGPSMETLKIAIEDGIATVRLNRPKVKNAMSLEMMDELYQAGLDLAEDRSLRAVILTGGDAVFCAGIDVNVIMASAQNMDGLKEQIASSINNKIGNKFQAPITVWATLPVPVIAALNGHCIGAGMQLALGADFRIASPDTKLSILEAKWGLIPDMGISQSLPKLMRADVAKELIMTGRMLEAAEAQRIGLITRIADDPIAAAVEMAEGFKSFSPDAVAQSKRLVDQIWGADEAAMKTEADLQLEIIGGANQMNKAMASFSKSNPSFKDRSV
ncbi:MAG: crotonase/enoyl-CoA hydratase family protein [Pseudomonadota bacterium]